MIEEVLVLSSSSGESSTEEWEASSTRDNATSTISQLMDGVGPVRGVGMVMNNEPFQPKQQNQTCQSRVECRARSRQPQVCGKQVWEGKRKKEKPTCMCYFLCVSRNVVLWSPASNFELALFEMNHDVRCPTQAVDHDTYDDANSQLRHAVTGDFAC